MKAVTFLTAMLALSLAAASPARAGCDPFAKAHKLYVAELNVMLKELKRVEATKPKPRTDAVFCFALRKVLRDTPYIVSYADRSCFQTDGQLQEFKTNVKNYAKNVATMAGLYCSAAEMKRPLPKLLDGKI
jgi:hypothetical protein